MESKSSNGNGFIIEMSLTALQPPEPRNEPINLIVAVSFGILVPPRILCGAKYGGLNVHPSLLPEYILLQKIQSKLTQAKQC